MTTKEAFAKLISERAWYKKAGLSEPQASSISRRFRTGEGLTIDKVEEILEKAGFKVVQDKIWGEPK